MNYHNFLLITVDDMNYNSIEFLKDSDKRHLLTPNLDKLRSEGAYFSDSHVAIALCQPSRSVLMTSKYPHCNGARGFENIAPNVKTLTGILHDKGFYNGIIGKENHISPREQFFWDMYEKSLCPESGYGRDPEFYYQKTTTFLSDAKKENKPFFLMVNSDDPHRPFANSEDEVMMFGKNLPCEEIFTVDDVEVPGMLPELDAVRTEFAEYLNSVHRGDKTIGRVLEALEEAGQTENTVIVFLSDNGMSMPFCKANCYLNSTKSPFIIKWAGKIEKNIEIDALVSSIDFMPTVLDIVGETPPEDIDGRSFLDLLYGKRDTQSETIYTTFFKTAKNHITKAEKWFPMRCVQDKRFAYIYNGWSDGETHYQTETMAGLTFEAMKEAAKTDEKIAKRVSFYLERIPEEFYDYKNDPNALNNLIDSPQHKEKIGKMRQKMLEYMMQSNDELLAKYKEFTN